MRASSEKTWRICAVLKMSRKIAESSAVAVMSFSASCDLALAREAVEMREHLLDVHDVGIFVVQVEQIDLVVDQRAVVGAFLHHNVVEAVGIGIDRRGAHAARRALAADDQAVDPLLLQVSD